MVLHLGFIVISSSSRNIVIKVNLFATVAIRSKLFILLLLFYLALLGVSDS